MHGTVRREFCFRPLGWMLKKSLTVAQELDIALAPSRAALTPSRFAMTPPPRTALMSSPCLALEDASPAAQSAAGGLLLLTAAPGTEAAAANLETGALAVADDARAHRGAERARRLPARTDDAQLHLVQPATCLVTHVILDCMPGCCRAP